MGKMPVFTSVSSSGVLCYRRKIFTPADNQQLEQQLADTKHQQQKQQQKHRQSLQSQLNPPRIISASSHERKGIKSPPTHRLWSKSRQPKPALLKQLLWKAKAVQPTSVVILHQQSWNNNEEDEEATFFKEQRQAQKLLASEARMLSGGKSKAVVGAGLTSSEIFVAESSSQETQSGSDDEDLYMPYHDLLPAVQLPVPRQVFMQRKGKDEKTEGEGCSSPVVPPNAIEISTKGQKESALGEKSSIVWKRSENCKQKQHQRRVEAKKQKRLLRGRKQVYKKQVTQSCSIVVSASSAPDSDIVAVDPFHRPLDLASKSGTEVGRAGLSQLKKVAPHIVVGDVACPIATNEQQLVRSVAGKGLAKDTAGENLRQHVIFMRDRYLNTQMQDRECFVVEGSGFDAASSYDFLKSRFSEIQRSASIKYY